MSALATQKYGSAEEPYLGNDRFSAGELGDGGDLVLFGNKIANGAAAVVSEAAESAWNVQQLDAAARLLWMAHGHGTVADDEAEQLASEIDRRRHHLRTQAAKRRASRFTSRQRPRSPDRKASRDRRRTLGGSSALPSELRAHYTEGQRAVMCIIAGEIKRQGFCDLVIDKIAALAGVCRTTVQTALHEARRLGHLIITERRVPGRNSLPNIVKIVCSAWLAWLKRGVRAQQPDRVQFRENGEHHEEKKDKKGQAGLREHLVISAVHPTIAAKAEQPWLMSAAGFVGSTVASATRNRFPRLGACPRLRHRGGGVAMIAGPPRRPAPRE